MMERFLPQTIANANWKTTVKKTTFNDPVATHDCIQHVCPRWVFPTKWHPCNRPFVAVGMLQQQWCHGPHHNRSCRLGRLRWLPRPRPRKWHGFGKARKGWQWRTIWKWRFLGKSHPSLLLGENIYCWLKRYEVRLLDSGECTCRPIPN